jgi:hypothetical protein
MRLNPDFLCGKGLLGGEVSSLSGPLWSVVGGLV